MPGDCSQRMGWLEMVGAPNRIGGQAGRFWWQADVEIAGNGSVRVLSVKRSDPERGIEMVETGWSETYISLEATRESIERYLKGQG